ncbi:MAG: HesA/MoeB/ThiF family protein [Bacteroidota bacterium]|nr:HesA/MoeB/ThiF family protein [Bacteroidota bacterium]
MSDKILSLHEIKRYSRQILLPEIGVSGQELLKQAKVIIVGAGGLGCPVLQYLAAAGIGRLAVAESGMVDESDLQRQILYGSNDVGKLKSIIAAVRIESLNDLVKIDRINLRIEAANALRVLADYDIIVDATDNYPTRFLLSDASVILNKPMVHGAIYKYEGQVSVFNYRGGPTYRCFNPNPLQADFRNPASDETGLLGVVPGITGTIMANEVIKIITGYGDILSGKLLILNIYDYVFRILKLECVPENHNINRLNETY